jgi:hypothetical protein
MSEIKILIYLNLDIILLEEMLCQTYTVAWILQTMQKLNVHKV